MKRWLYALPLVVLAALGLLFGLYALNRDPQVQPDALVGKPMPALTLASLGQSHDDASHWLPFVGVEDIAATVAQARELGGSVLVEPTDIPAMGAFAILQDPQGVVIAAFSGNCT